MCKRETRFVGMVGIFSIILFTALILLVLGIYVTAQAAEKVMSIYAMGDYSGPYGGITTPGLAAHRDVIK